MPVFCRGVIEILLSHLFLDAKPSPLTVGNVAEICNPPDPLINRLAFED